MVKCSLTYFNGFDEVVMLMLIIRLSSVHFAIFPVPGT